MQSGPCGALPGEGMLRLYALYVVAALCCIPSAWADAHCIASVNGDGACSGIRQCTDTLSDAGPSRQELPPRPGATDPSLAVRPLNASRPELVGCGSDSRSLQLFRRSNAFS